MRRSKKNKKRQRARRGKADAPRRFVDAGEFLDDLVAEPPENPHELQQRLRTVEQAAVRGLIVDRIADTGLSANQRAVCIAVLELIGVDGSWEQLAALVTDRDGDTRIRSSVLRLLQQVDAERAQDLLVDLDADALQSVIHQSVVDLMETIDLEPESAVALAETLISQPSPERISFIETLEALRKETGTPAALVWAPALKRRELADVRDTLLAIVVQEGTSAGEDLLDALARNASGKKVRRQFQRALMKLRSDRIDPVGHGIPVRGRAWASSCDGQGAYILFGAFRGSGGRVRVSNVCLRSAADVRDAFLLPDSTEREARDLMKEMEITSSVEFAEVPPSEAGVLVTAAVTRTRAMGRRIRKEYRSALAAFEQAARSRKPGDVETQQVEPLDGGTDEESDGRPTDQLSLSLGEEYVAVPPKTATRNKPDSRIPSLQDYRRLLEEQRYDTWFFDANDLARGGAGPPPAKRTSIKWLREAARGLAVTDAPLRLLGMLEYTAWWHRQRGDEDQALLFLAAAEECESSFTDSNFVRAMLGRSAHIYREEHASALPRQGAGLGDPKRRRSIRQQLFVDLEEIQGRHVAYLDFTEAALDFLEFTKETLPDANQPIFDDLIDTAGRAGELVADFLIDLDDESGTASRIQERVLRPLLPEIEGSFGLGEHDVRLLAVQLVEVLMSFAGEVCEACPVHCLDRPDEPMVELFHSPVFPAALDVEIQ